MGISGEKSAQESAPSDGSAGRPARAGGVLARGFSFAVTGMSAHAVLYVTAAVGLALVVGLAAAGAEIYDAVADQDGLASFDQPVLDLAIAHRTAANSALVTDFTHLGGPTGMSIIASVITVAMVWRWRSRTPLILMLIAVAGSLTLTSAGKAVVGRARPPLAEAVPPYEYAFSFPSGHALNSTVIAGLVAYLLVRRLRTRRMRAFAVVMASGWAVSMGVSRVFLGHHWLTDVMFGWLVGAAWLAMLITAHRLFLAVRKAGAARRGHIRSA